MVEGCQDLPKQRRAVENNMQKNGESCLQRILFWKQELVVEPRRSTVWWQNMTAQNIMVDPTIKRDGSRNGGGTLGDACGT